MLSDVKITTENKCSFCKPAICCSYITQEIETPRSKIDFENLLWQVSHDHISIYQEEDGWYLLISGQCQHLLKDGGCGIYETRPNACRDYSNEFCEFDEPAEESFNLLFENYDSLLTYCQNRFKSWSSPI
ncbi:MAG: YkgJ family cysteine cluster protein [Methylococcales bacterium]|jgi:uncharacterized protein|nr:YkgJ family cysteine cluster protein [Methylococcales bacterium]MBT7446124.1 YkgJ family cysteine cluster protein [Methylococcales bacterium]